MASNDDRSLRAPIPDPKREASRAIVEAVAGLTPIGGALARIYQTTHPSKSETDRQRWIESITERTNEHGARLDEYAEALLRLEEYLEEKTYRPEAGEAGRLSFFKTGMLGSLEIIAEGGGNEEIRMRLARQLDESEAEVSEIIAKLTNARNKIIAEPGGADFAHRLDEILYDGFGKVNIRRRIGEVINGDIKSKGTKDIAREICDEIKKFNRLVISLNEPIVQRGGI